MSNDQVMSNGEPLLPKTKEGEAMEGMRVFVYLTNSSATVSDLRVGNQRKKPTKSANKRVQGADVEGERAVVPRHYPSFSPLDALLFSFPLSPSLSRLSSSFTCGLQKRAQARGLAVHRQAFDTDRKSLAPFTAGGTNQDAAGSDSDGPFQPAGCLIFIMLKLH